MVTMKYNSLSISIVTEKTSSLYLRVLQCTERVLSTSLSVGSGLLSLCGLSLLGGITST